MTGSRIDWKQALWMPTLVVSQPMVASSLSPREGVILKPGRAMVEARIRKSGRDVLPIQFALGFDMEKGWMVENVVIAGINTGLTLRNQFADLVKSRAVSPGQSILGRSSQ